MSRGVEALSERELIALVIGQGRRGESSVDVAAALLSEFGGLEGLARARPEELQARGGIGPAKAAALTAAFRLGALAGSESPEGPVLRSAADAAAIAVGELGHARRERVIVLVCDPANRLRRIVTVSEGSADRAQFPVREILNAVLRNDGRAFVVAHNHPSGDATPSPQDIRATEDLAAAARTVGLRFLDHVVVSGTDWSIVNQRERMRD